ncbi:MAG TPA: phasin family protein [Acetobacteraceae bacterium]|nr:phasin family protein [Acetobacteraceae bacterium]
MSETRKNRDTTARATREAMDRGEAAANQAAEEFRDMGETVADTVAKTADAAVEMGQRVAEQGREVIMLGVRAAAGMNGRLAEVGYGRGHRVLGAAARAMQIWHEGGDNTAESLQALFSSYLRLGQGVRQMQHVWLDMLDHAVDAAAHAPQDLLRCKSLEELAEVQRNIYLGAVNRAVESSSALFQLAAQTAQQAMRPLPARAGDGGHG